MLADFPTSPCGVFAKLFINNVGVNHLMKLNKIAIACGAALMGVTAVAQAEISANIGATSNYVWRGVTQTDDQAAISGGIDWSSDSGFYVGTWVSNVDFGPGAGETEWDIYGGLSGEMSGIGYDVGYSQYMYPDTADADFGEIYLGLSWEWLSGGVHYTAFSDVNETAGTADYFQEGDVYAYIGASFDLPQGFTAGLTLGHYWFDDDGDGGENIDYMHGQIDVSKSAGDFGDFTFSLSKAEKESGSDDFLPFVSWSKSF
jgi:uncharacterized protein (TIGR02001 family)